MVGSFGAGKLIHETAVMRTSKHSRGKQHDQQKVILNKTCYRWQAWENIQYVSQAAVGHFQMVFRLFFKVRPVAQEMFCTRPDFATRLNEWPVNLDFPLIGLQSTANFYGHTWTY